MQRDSGSCCKCAKRKAKDILRARARSAAAAPASAARRYGHPAMRQQRRSAVEDRRSEHSTAQHSTAQHSTAQHSTAQLSSQCLRCAALLWPPVLLPWTIPLCESVPTASSSVLVAPLAVRTNTQQCRPKQSAGFHSPRAAAGFHSPRADHARQRL